MCANDPHGRTHNTCIQYHWRGQSEHSTFGTAEPAPMPALWWASLQTFHPTEPGAGPVERREIID